MNFKLLPLFALLGLTSCGDDRSGEQPFAPTVETGTASVVSSTVTLAGTVLSSPNSTLTACGFVYGTSNSSLTSKGEVATPATVFSLAIDTLSAGTYYYSAYATNGMGTSYGDTLSFVIP